MEFRLDKGTGYMYSYSPKHPCANKAGKVMEHVYVMYSHIERPLEKDECVHHIDRDKTNNEISNLMLLTISDHARLHQIENGNGGKVEKTCPCCRSIFESLESQDQKFCSVECNGKFYRRFEVSKEELTYLVWSVPTIKVAKLFGVSDKAVEKRCKLLGVEKPPRGYWAKVASGKMVNNCE